MDKSLSHVGVLGMRWGRRGGSSGPFSGSTGNSSKPQSVHLAHPDHRDAHALKSKKLSDMSNSEIHKLVTRMDLEKRYKDARKQDSSVGKKFVADVLANAGKQVAATYVAKFMGHGVQALIDIFKMPKK